jgi:ABC-type glycerol-3-phosphate transport system substrate-binding protein
MKRGVLLLLGLIGAAVITALIIFLVRSAGDSAPKDKVLKIWSPFDEKKIYQEISRDFTDANPGVGLEFEFIDAKDAKEYEARVVNAIADGDGPDIWLVRNDWIPKHAPKSLAAVVSNPEEDPIALAKTKIEPALVDLNVFENKLYGIPLTADSLMMLYNLDFYNNVANAADEAGKKTLGVTPTTWSDLSSQSAVVSQRKEATIQRSAIALGTVDTTFAPSDVLTAFMTQAEVAILTEDKKNVGFNLARFKGGIAEFPATDVLDFYTSFARVDKSNYSWNDTMGNPIDAFVNQKTGALIGYYSTLQTILNRDPNFEIRVVPLVQRQEKTDRVDYATTWSFIVNSETTQPQLSWNYLSYMANELVQQKYSEKTNKPPATKYNNPTIIVPSLKLPSEAAELVRLQFRTAKQFVKPEWQQTDEIFQDAIRQVVILGKTAQNSADSAAERFKIFVTP